MDRDRTIGETFYLLFTTRAFATGIPTVLAGTPGVSAIEDNSATPITAGITLGVDHASVVGLNLLTIVATVGNGFEAGKDYSLYIDAGTVATVSVIGEVVGSFSLGLSAAFTRLGAPAGASVSADIAAIEAQTDDIGVAGAGLTDLGGMSTGMKDEVEVEANDALVAQKLDHLVAVADADDPVDNSIMAKVVSATGDWSLFVPGTDSLQAIRDRGDAAWVTGAVAPTVGAIADAVWDELLTGSSHNIATSAGRRLRQIEEAFVHASGVIAVVTDGHTFTLDAGAVATADYYIGDRLQITEGTGAGQTRIIVAYSAGRVVILDSDFVTNPDTSSLYEIDAADVHVALASSDLVAGFVAVFTNTTTITLDAAAVALEGFYIGQEIIFPHGLGMGQAREIVGYTAGRVLTMSPALVSDLDTTTVYHIKAAVSIPEIVSEVWAEPLPGAFGAGEAGNIVASIDTDITTLLARITATLFSGMTSLGEWLGLMAGKQVGDATARTEIRATGAAGGTFDETVDSEEAIRDRGDAAWITAPNDPTVAAIVAGVWGEALPGAFGAGEAGQIVGDNLNATVGSRATQADILSDATPFAGANIDAAITTRATPAEVNAEVLDVLNVDTFAEPTGVPPATATLVEKIGRLHMALRNGLTITATKKTFLDDGGAGEWSKSLADNGTTYTEGEAAVP